LAQPVRRSVADVLIAPSGRRGAILVTANKIEFARVLGLQTQDWTIA
jgi:predicted nucleic acid-binding protein